MSLGQTWGYDFTMHLDEFAQRNLLWSLWKKFILWILISFKWYEFLCRVIRYWGFEWCLHLPIPSKGMIIMSKRIFCDTWWIPLSAAEKDWARLETLSSYYNLLHMGRKQITFRKSWCRIERQLTFMRQMYRVKSGWSSTRQQHVTTSNKFIQRIHHQNQTRVFFANFVM